MQSLHQRGPGRKGGKLVCDVDRPSIMAAAAVFRHLRAKFRNRGFPSAIRGLPTALRSAAERGAYVQ